MAALRDLSRFVSDPALTAYLDAVASAPWTWGACLTFMADWVTLKTGVDPAAIWRGAYSSEADAEALLARHGGRLALARLGMAAFPPGAAVGVVEVLSLGSAGPETIQIGGIAEGARWYLRSRRGVWTGPAKLIEGWEV